MMPKESRSERLGNMAPAMAAERHLRAGAARAAAQEALFRGANQGKYRDFGLDRIAIAGEAVPLQAEVLLETPFLVLRSYRRADLEALPPLVLVPPLSGHLPVLLRDMMVGLAADFRLIVLDWANVRHVPLVHRTFGFDANIAAVGAAIRLAGPGASVVALCQGGVPALAAVADLAARTPAAAPAALVLIAAPVDPAAAPTPVVRRIRESAALRWGVFPVAPVGPDQAGRGRRVYPARIQLAALRAYLARQRAEGGELAGKIDHDDGADPARFPFLDLYTAIMDLDARQFIENLDRVFLRREIARGRLRFDGRPVAPAAIRRTALLTIEGEADDIAAPGQTSAAHGLCPALPEALRRAAVIPGCGHFGLFHGAIWRQQVLPLVRAHCVAAR